MVKKLVNTGTAHFENDLHPLVRAANVICLTASGLSLSNSLTFVSLGLNEAALTNLLLPLLYGLPLLLNAAGRRRTANITLGVVAIGQLFLVPYFFLGPGFGLHYYQLCVPTLLLLTTRPVEILVLPVFFILSMAGLIYIEFFLQVPLYPFEVGNLDLFVIRIANLSMAVLMVCFVMYLFSRDLALARSEARQQFERAERLVLNILPPSIAARLKDSEETIADRFGEASVLFADIVGFTPLAARKEADELVSILNRYFSAYDDLTVKHGVEKIKTIGDAYMVAAGIPRSDENHAGRIADFALEMLRVTAELSFKYGLDINIRIGINSGPVVAGVIGKRKFNYDLWGDTVNTASRMESHGEAGRIQVSEATWQLIQNEFIFSEAVAKEFKGLGQLQTRYLKSRFS